MASATARTTSQQIPHQINNVGDRGFQIERGVRAEAEPVLNLVVVVDHQAGGSPAFALPVLTRGRLQSVRRAPGKKSLEVFLVFD